MRIGVLALTCILAAAPARAEVIVWRDADTAVTLTTPDDWARAVPHAPQEAIAAVAPGNAARITISAEADRRFVVYPARYAAPVQKAAIDPAFWQAYWDARYDGVAVLAQKDGAGLGRAHAGLAEARFTPIAGPDAGQARRGVVAAGLYAGRLYTAECSAAEADWPAWTATCWRILGTLDMHAVDHPFPPSGHYRDFMTDGPLRVEGPRPQDTRLR
ncbi:MAG TPA: hypothetical protein DDX54_03425 [Rhodospirillaceae bacterium]|jgi:hypothetical protein|nr:hypothetical protein [Alphaproteobacteria bacterium]HBH26434.1 hypothetical protein [Rhodospirillaceae bacterium]